MVDPVNGAGEEHPKSAETQSGLWKRFVVHPVMGQLKQGISPEKLGWSVGAGVTIGIFPVWGTRAWICLLVGWLFRMNQPILHGFKSLLYPVQILLLIPFIHMGQWIFGKPPLRISMEFLKAEFGKGWWEFLSRFGWVIFHAAIAWLIVAPVVLIALKWMATPLLKKAGMKITKSKEATA